MNQHSDLVPLSIGPAQDPVATRVAGASSTSSLTRPSLPRSRPLSAGQIQAVDLEEQMEPLAVAESAADSRRSVATLTGQLVVIAVAAATIWWLLPAGIQARPPLQLPEPLQAEAAPIAKEQRDEEATAIALLKKAVPTRALAAFRRCVDSTDATSVTLWRYYLQTLVDLDERGELRHRARQFALLHPDRLEGPHFQSEAICRDDIDAHREQGGPWNAILETVGTPKIAASYLAEIDRCENTISDALNLLQQHDGDWSAAGRTAWADLLHLDRARLHHHAWKCRGLAFADPHREAALAAIRQMSSADGLDSLALRLDIYRTCRDRWPKTLGFDVKRQLVNGLDWSKDDLQRAIDADRAAIERLPPTGRR